MAVMRNKPELVLNKYGNLAKTVKIATSYSQSQKVSSIQKRNCAKIVLNLCHRCPYSCNFRRKKNVAASGV